MNNIINIIKKNMIERFAVYNRKKQFNGIPKKYIPRLLFLTAGYVLFGFAVHYMMTVNADKYLANGDIYSYFKSFMSITTFMILMFSLMKVMSDFFSAKDNLILMTFPIKSEELFLGKFFGIILSDIDFLLYLFIVMSIYFNHMGFNVFIALFSIYAYFINLIIPYAFITIIMLLIAKFFNFTKHKTFFRNFKQIIRFLVLGIVFFVAFSGNKGVLTKEYGIYSWFVNAHLFGAMMTFDVVSIILSTLLAICLVFIIYMLSKMFYLDILSSNLNETESSRKKKISFKKKNIKIDLFLKEIRNILGNLVFLTNVFINTIIFSIVLMSSGSNPEKIIPPDVTSLDINLLMLLVGATVGFLIWANNSLSTTSLSREGKSYYIIKTTPIKPNDNLVGRALALFFIYVIFNTIMSIVLFFGMNLTIINALMLFLGLVISSGFSVFLGLFFEHFVLNTEWEKPEELNQFRITNAVEFIISIVILILAVTGLFLSLIYLESRIIAIIIFFFVIALSTFIFYLLALSKYKKI